MGTFFPQKHADNRVWLPKNPDRIKTLERPCINTLMPVFWVAPKFTREATPGDADGSSDVFTGSWRAWVPELGRYVAGDELIRPKDAL